MRVQLADIKPPAMPNVANIYSNPGVMVCIDIADFTKEEAEQYADMMRETFLKHWEERKKRREAVKQATGEGYWVNLSLDNSQEK